jgi:hypothetical protein
LQGSDVELIKLADTSRTLCPVHHASSPATCYNPVANEKWSPASLLLPGPQRCYTTGVDRLPSSCPSSTQVTSLPTVNILFNSAVSDNAFFGYIDLSDFYLGTDFNPSQYIKIFIYQLSYHVLSRLNLLPSSKLTPPPRPTYIVFRINKTMYGLKEAGKLSNLRLVSLLSTFGFYETTTPCLFKHVSRPILFVLVVEDFGVKYTNRSDFDFLVSCLSTLYHAKADLIASKFLGFSVSHNRTARTFNVSYPGYASHLLARLRPLGVSPCNSPSIYTPPVFGSRAPQFPTGPDLSPSATHPEQAKELQVAVGFLLYYGRCVDFRILPATCALASEQASPTLSTMACLQRLLGYVAAPHLLLSHLHS